MRVAFGGQGGVAAGDEAFSGVVGVGDLSQVGFVEQAELEGPVVGGQRLDLGGPQCGDPAETAEGFEGIDTGGGDHAQVSDHHHVVETETVFDFDCYCVERGRVRGVTGEHFDGDGSARKVGDQAVFDLFFASFLVPGVAPGSQLAVAALDVGGGQVVEHHPTGGQVPGRQGCFDAVLTPHQPVHRPVDFVGRSAGHSKVFPHGGVGPLP